MKLSFDSYENINVGDRYWSYIKRNLNSVPASKRKISKARWSRLLGGLITDLTAFDFAV